MNFYRYKLKSGGALGKGNQGVFEGILIKNNGGYGCIHPWVSLGDGSVDDQLKLLKNGEDSPLVKQALRCAEIDGEARKNGTWLFEEVVPIGNHWQWRRWSNFEDEVRCVSNLGIMCIKMKAGSLDELCELGEWMSRVSEVLNGVRFRLDFNCNFQYDEVRSWWEKLSEAQRDTIDWVEDPCSISESLNDWMRLRELGMSLGLDRDFAIYKDTDFYDVGVIKPAIDELDWDKLPRDKRYCFTSYLDHPIGQLWALWNAREATRMGVCFVENEHGENGLASHLMFDVNDFSKELIIGDGGVLVPATGTGLGFDDLLKDLPWEKV